MIRIPGRNDNLPHPHVDMRGEGDERILVPCFSKGGDELESYLTDQKSEAFADNQVFVELDNRECVKWVDGRKGTESCWLVGRMRRVVETALGDPVGTLDAESVQQIARSMLAREAKRSGYLPPKSKEFLGKLAQDLKPDKPVKSVADRVKEIGRI